MRLFQFVSRKNLRYLHLQVLIDVLRSERDFCVGYTMLLYIPGKRAGFFVCLLVRVPKADLEAFELNTDGTD